MASSSGNQIVPNIKIPHMARSRLNSIGRKIDDKLLLLAGEFPERYVEKMKKKLGRVGEEEEETSYGEETEMELHPQKGRDSLNAAQDEEPDAEKKVDGKKASIPPAEFQLCRYCSQRYHPDRIQSHQDICREISRRSDKIPFLVKLGLKNVDTDKDEAAALAAEEKEQNSCRFNSHAKSYSGVNDLEDETEKSDPSQYAFSFMEDDVLEPLPTEVPFAGGGRNWTKQHEKYMKALEEAKRKKELYASGQFPDLPRPPDSRELEVEYVQCPFCLIRFFPDYNAADHIGRCSKTVQRNCSK